MSQGSKYSQEVERIVASIDEHEPAAEHTEPLTGEEEEPEEVIHIHHYPNAIVIEKEIVANQPRIVESTPTAKETVKPRAPANVFFLALFIAMLLPLSCLGFELYVASIQPSATVTILSTETPVTTHATISLPTHIFTPLMFSQSQTVPTTGRTHQNATYATGYVTFHNALTQQQTIDAGTLITGADGIQVVTDETAYVPAGTFSGYGEVTVSAHAVNAGSSGNISAGDINGTCCRVYILVRNNNPFSGGQSARDYQSVAKSDIQHVVSNLTQQFQQTLQGKTTSLVPSSESLLTPIPCTSTMQSDHAVGAEAMQVSVTLHETCTPVSYNTQDFQSQAESTLSHVATQKLGTGYSLLGNVEASIEKTMLKNTSLIFTVVSSGMWVYQFNTHQLATLIKGKCQQDALALLQKQNGITHISMQVSGTKHDTLPADPAQIHFLVFYVPV